jgi:hypothetical protein
MASLIIAIATVASAQDTRESQLAAQQAEKATSLRPYEPDQLEERLLLVDGLMTPTRPIYPFIGSMFDGGGIAIGPGYRGRYGDTGRFDAHAAWSVKNYKSADATLVVPAFADRRVVLAMRANWQDAPDVAFYGVGNDSRPEGRIGYAYRATTVGVSGRVQAARLVAVGGGLDSLQLQTGPARTDTSIVSADRNYRVARLFAEFDWRTAARYTRRGGLYRLEWADYHQANAGSNSFGRVDAEAQHFVPLLRENWVIALRALATSTITAPGEQVPVALLPDLGGSHALRGYSAWRFRDRNRLLLTGEYRWIAGPFVDMALFVDAGKVAAELSGLNFHDLKTAYGIGASFHTLTSTMTRIELARTHEGTSLAFSFSPSF